MSEASPERSEFSDDEQVDNRASTTGLGGVEMAAESTTVPCAPYVAGEPNMGLLGSAFVQRQGQRQRDQLELQWHYLGEGNKSLS